MKKILCYVAITQSYLCSYAQSIINKIAVYAFIITRMAEKFHIQPKTGNNSFPVHVFEALI